MNVQLNSLSDTRKTLVVSLSAEEVATEHKAVVGEFVRQARLPGFRPGKAPAAMIERRFAKEIAGELEQKVVASAYKESLEKEKLDVLSVVNVEPGEIKQGVEATVTVTVDVRPEFELPEYSGIAVKAPPSDVSDGEIEDVIERIRSERAEFKTAERAAQKGDYVKLAYEGHVDGQAIVELVPEKQIYGKVPQTWVEVESEEDGIIPGLGKQIAGLAPGEKKTVEVAFPAEFSAAPALAGKQASYAIEILEVRERILPEVDDAFLKANQVESLDALKEQISSAVKSQKERDIHAAKRAQVMKTLDERLSFEVPESLIEGETQEMLRELMSQNLRRGVSQEELERNKEELYANARTRGGKRAKLQLALARVAEAEKLKVENEDLQQYVYSYAMNTQQSPDKVVQELGKNRDLVRRIQQNILFDKTVDLIVSKAVVTVVPAEELAAEAAAAEAKG